MFIQRESYVTRIKSTESVINNTKCKSTASKYLPIKNQVLLSLKMHRKTGSSDAIDTLHRLGHGLSYSETLSVKDNWAEWSQYKSNLIPSNIISGVPTAFLLDNMDWKNKSIRRSSNETHHTNCIGHVKFKICSKSISYGKMKYGMRSLFIIFA